MAAGDRKGRPYVVDPVGAGLAPARERPHDDGRMYMDDGRPQGSPLHGESGRGGACPRP